jgi:RpiB/LacA/LacB family sugar-phosphate isomerase
MKKYNLILPIAGKAQRFIDAGYPMPKPLIHAGEEQIIDLSISSINTEDCNLIFVVRRDHILNFNIDNILKMKFGEDIEIITIDTVTRGALETCYLAIEGLDLTLPLIIYTPDVYFKPTFDPKIIQKDSDGFLLTFPANSPDHSYVKVDENGDATLVAEKEVISEQANVGLYYFSSGEIFQKYAGEAIENEMLVRNEFFIAPIYNLLIRDGLKINTLSTEKMYVLGTPENLKFFEDKIIKSFEEKSFVLSSDHSGYELKEETKKILDEKKISYIDVGTMAELPCDYSDYVQEAIKAVKNKRATYSLSFCRTGQGVNVAANKSNHIATIVFDAYTAEYAIRHNCSDFLSIPTKYVDNRTMSEIIDSIMSNSFDGGRHYTRITKAIGGLK